MTFVLNDEQKMLRDTAMSFARDELPVSHLRGLRDNQANGIDPATKDKLAELGFFGVLVPEAYDGVGLGMVAMGQIMEAQGRTLAATPLLSSGVLTVSVIDLAGSEAQKTEWLPKLASGEVVGALALDENAHHSPLNVSTEAERNGQGYTLNGAKTFVLGGHYADIFIVVARTFGEAGQAHGLSFFLVPSDAPGLTVTPLETVDSQGAANLTLENVAVSEEQIIGPVDGASDILETVLDRGRAALASETLGSASAAFEMTLEYLKTRKQFGQLIGSFQALQHRAAIMFTELELTRSCVGHALSAIDEQHNDVPQLTSLAKAMASDTVHLVSRETVQLHGGIGMTDDHDAGFYMKRARVQEAMLGGASFHRDRFASLNGF